MRRGPPDTVTAGVPAGCPARGGTARWVAALSVVLLAAGCLSGVTRPDAIAPDLTPEMMDLPAFEIPVAGDPADGAASGIALLSSPTPDDAVASLTSDPPTDHTAAPDGVGDAHLVQPFDSLRIDVFGEADISGDYPVTAEGAIRHPLLGSVPVAGMTLDQVEATLIAKLGRDYLVSPRVTVRMERSSGRQVTILGEVKKPGTYRVSPDDRLSLLRLVALAGGFTDLARVTHVRVIRDRGGEELVTRVNVSDLLRGRGQDRTADYDLMAGDIVMVPEAVW